MDVSFNIISHIAFKPFGCLILFIFYISKDFWWSFVTEFKVFREMADYSPFSSVVMKHCVLLLLCFEAWWVTQKSTNFQASVELFTQRKRSYYIVGAIWGFLSWSFKIGMSLGKHCYWICLQWVLWQILPSVQNNFCTCYWQGDAFSSLEMYLDLLMGCIIAGCVPHTEM